MRQAQVVRRDLRGSKSQSVLEMTSCIITQPLWSLKFAEMIHGFQGSRAFQAKHVLLRPAGIGLGQAQPTTSETTRDNGTWYIKASFSWSVEISWQQ